jgi:hypothetical protein
MPSLYEVFQTLPDPRRAQGKKFSLAGVLTLVVMALIAQQNSLRQIEAWVDGLDPSVGKPLGFRFGRMPDYSTIRRVLHKVDVDALTTAVTSWVQTAITPLPVTDGVPLPPEPVAIDGKTLRGSADDAEQPRALRVLGCLVHDLGVALGSQPIDPTTNEVGEFPNLLTRLVLEGRLVTGDAHYTNPTVARSIREKGGTIS